MIFNHYKKVLITTHSMIDYAGAEINAMSLAEEFIRHGSDVTIGCFRYDYPIKQNVDEKNIILKNLITDSFDEDDFDLVWIHHAPCLYHVILNHNINIKKLVFSSLSPFEPLEAPPLFPEYLSLFIANSFETRDRLLKEKIEQDNVHVFPNYATYKFMENVKKEISTEIKKICIVSNHLPKEIEDSLPLFAQMNIDVDIYGLMHNQKLIDTDTLLKYDAVITIGKTVQYAMVLGLPVFCYDIHGGPGWIDQSNYDVASYYNFSGRGFGVKFTPEELAERIISGYHTAVENRHKQMKRARKEFNLTQNLKELLDKVHCKPDVDLNGIKMNYRMMKRTHEAFMREYEYNYYRRRKIDDLEKQSINNENKISLLQEEINKYEESINIYKEKEEKMTKENSFLTEINNELNSKLIELENEMRNKQYQLDNIRSDFEEYQQTNNLKINELTQVNEKLINEISQKEENCKYLSELVQEKVVLINDMSNTKLWRFGEKVRKLRNKFRYLKQPSKIIKKIRRKNEDFAGDIAIASTVQTIGKDPLVSVVIPIYDRTEVLKVSIESILNQNYKNIELILVCDGSPEATLKIVRSYETHPQVRIFCYKDNSGNAVRGRNKAIREANGKYLAFQDSDDIAEIDRIRTSVEFMERHNADVVYGGWRALLDGTRDIELENNQEVFSPDCDYDMLHKICVPCQSTVMVKLDALRKVGGLKPKMRYREDHELWLRLAYNDYKFKSIPKILTNLRLHANNLELSFKDNDGYWEELTLKEHKIIERMKPKIGYVVAGTGISGGLSVICKHANELLTRGYDVLIISEDGNEEINWYPNQNVQVVPINQVPDNLDIVIATYWTTAYTIQRIPAEKKYYFVQSDESKFFEVGSKEAKAALDSYKLDYTYITMARWLQKWLKTTFNQESFYVPNGIDNKIIYKTEPLSPREGKLRVLLEGPIDVPFKGMKEAFEVVQDLDCEVWCVSSSGKPHKDWKCDRFFEKVPFDKMKYIYSSCDVLLKMSSVESFCLPALEMMAVGGVCVLNKFTGIEEFCVNEYNALIVEKGDIAAARESIKMLIENQDLFQRLSNNALITAKEWGWDNRIDELELIFK